MFQFGKSTYRKIKRSLSSSVKIRHENGGKRNIRNTPNKPPVTNNQSNFILKSKYKIYVCGFMNL